jgi:hypothetical protein
LYSLFTSSSHKQPSRPRRPSGGGRLVAFLRFCVPYSREAYEPALACDDGTLCCLCCLCHHHSRTPTSPCACPPLAGSPPPGGDLLPLIPAIRATPRYRPCACPPPAGSPASGGDLMPLIPLMPAIRATPRYRPLACPAAPTFSAFSARFAHPHLTMRYLPYRVWPLRSTLHSPRSTAGERMAKREEWSPTDRNTTGSAPRRNCHAEGQAAGGTG